MVAQVQKAWVSQFADPKATIKLEVVGQTNRPTTGKEGFLLALVDCKAGLLQLGVKEDLFTQVLTYAAHCDPSVASRALPWVMTLKTEVGHATTIYNREPASYWLLAKQLGFKNPQLVELRKRVKAALECWSNRPMVLRPAR